MVANLNTELDQYVADTCLPTDTIFHILKICHQLRAKKLDDAIQYWVGALERHAMEIHNPETPSEEIGSLSSSARLLSIHLHLLKDIQNLCMLLTDSRGAIH